MGEQDHARRADGDRNADALDNGLHGETLLDGDDLKGGVDRRPGRAVGQDDVGEARTAASTKRP